MDFYLYPLGERGVVLEYGTSIHPSIQKKIQLVSSFFEKNQPAWMIEFIPAFTTITILYDPMRLTYNEACAVIKSCISTIDHSGPSEPRMIDIPVCYGGQMGPDIENVAKYNGLTTDEVIQIHSSGDYLVYMIGFSPGFPYIGGLSEKIATPRKESPRSKIPARSVGIAGLQTGIYPIETPGGWQLIGRTPTELFLPSRKEPSLLRAGDRIRFIPITIEEYKELENKQHDYDS